MSEENIITNTPEAPKPVMPDVSIQLDVSESEIKKAKEEPAAAVAAPAASSGPSERKKFFYTKKVCKFCTRQLDAKTVDYKNDMLKRYVMPSGKILPRRISGNCAKHQRMIVREIKKARIIALLPFLDR